MSDKVKIVVLGAAESGVGAALLAKAKGFEVFVSDSGKIAEASLVQRLNGLEKQASNFSSISFLCTCSSSILKVSASGTSVIP